MRTPLVAGNWKMHGNRASNRALLDAVLAGLEGLAGVECAVCVPFPYLGEVAGRLEGARLAWGAQNLSEHAQGACTGEVSVTMIKEFGCRYVIVGHSERRQLMLETDAMVAAKLRAAHRDGLTPIVCVGETLAVGRGPGGSPLPPQAPLQMPKSSSPPSNSFSCASISSSSFSPRAARWSPRVRRGDVLQRRWVLPSWMRFTDSTVGTRATRPASATSNTNRSSLHAPSGRVRWRMPNGRSAATRKTPR